MNPAIDDISKYAAPHRDRWHYLDYRDGKHDGQYTEWKYFNFMQGDMAGYIMYIVIDPEHRTPIGSGRLIARILHGNNFHGGAGKIPMDKVELDAQTASANFGAARLDEKTPHRYDISGNVAGISWNLQYEQSTPTLDGYSDTNFGILPWEKTSWLVKMPRARVTGTITINNTPIKLSALGYSDTNWGEFVPLFSRYEWAQFNDEKISVVYGVIYRFGRIYRTYAYVEIDRNIINFDGGKFKIMSREWGEEESTEIRTPAKTRFEVASGPYTLEVEYAPVRTDMVGLKILSWLPKPVVAEQISKFTGSLKRGGTLMHSFSGLGFSEYSPKTWKSIAVTI